MTRNKLGVAYGVRKQRLKFYQRELEELKREILSKDVLIDMWKNKAMEYKEKYEKELTKKRKNKPTQEKREL